MATPSATQQQPQLQQQKDKVHVAKEILHVFEEYKVGVKPNSFIVITGTTAEQGSKYPPNTFRLCLIEDVWLTIHLNSSGYL
ncbi:hypothetical protein HDU98_008627, partial [Podochytrium sp. JEL0797]